MVKKNIYILDSPSPDHGRVKGWKAITKKLKYFSKNELKSSISTGIGTDIGSFKFYFYQMKKK
jgi:hypothetical protein